MSRVGFDELQGGNILHSSRSCQFSIATDLYLTLKTGSSHFERSGKMELPEWTDIVKTGVLKELAPYDPHWYYIRAASVARKIYLRGGLSVGAFRRIYGGRKRNGSRPPRFGKSSESVSSPHSSTVAVEEEPPRVASVILTKSPEGLLWLQYSQLTCKPVFSLLRFHLMKV